MICLTSQPCYSGERMPSTHGIESKMSKIEDRKWNFGTSRHK